MSTTEQARNRLQQTLNGYQGAALLMAAGELDLFSPLLRKEEGLSAEELCREVESDLRGTVVLLDALCALGFLRKTEPASKQPEHYMIADDFKELLDIDHPQTFIPMIRHAANCMRQWSQLAWTAKSGIPAPEHASCLGPEEDGRSFILAMNSISGPTVGPLVEKMKAAGLFPFKHLLDIGSGPGTYSIALLNAVPGARATLFDLPVGLQCAKERLREARLDDRATFVEGNFYKDELPGGADFVWLSAIIHQHGREQSRALYRKIFKALVPGGRLAIRDTLFKPGRTAPVFANMFAANMLANTAKGMVYTFEEIEEDLQSAGFSDVRLAIPAEDMSSVVLARRV